MDRYPMHCQYQSLLIWKDNEAACHPDRRESQRMDQPSDAAIALCRSLGEWHPVTIIVKAGGAVRIPLEWSTMLGFLFTPIGIV